MFYPTPKFIAELSSLSEHVTQTPKTYAPTKEFLRDLNILQSDDKDGVSPNPTKTDQVTLLEIERFFKSARIDAQNAVENLISCTDCNDPIFCPVSLFGTLDLGKFEKAHTKTLSWLFDHKREHGFVDTLARAFLQLVNDEFVDSDVEVQEVTAEYPFLPKGSRGSHAKRIDILLRGTRKYENTDPTSWIVLIEAKIDQSFTEDQLDTIENFAEQLDVDERFLVQMGPKASFGHNCKPHRGWHIVTFEKLASKFRSTFPTLKNTDGFHFLRYYLSGVLRDVCGWELPIQEKRSNPYRIYHYLSNT